jgi:beta-galactosidase
MLKIKASIIVLSTFLLLSFNPKQNRETILLSGQWSFCIDSFSRGDQENWAEQGLPSVGTRIVSVPHAWNAEKGLEKYWGKCWYQRGFKLTEKQLSKTIRLQFDGIYHDATIFINGRKALEHNGSGYTRFFVDATRFLKVGDNTLTVRVDNSKSTNNIPFMESYDWPNDGGIIRNVNLLVTNAKAIKNMQITAKPNGNKGSADFIIKFLDASKIDFTKIKLKAVIAEENQSTQKQIFNGILNGKVDKEGFRASLAFDNIRAWHFDSPNLYKITVKLLVNGVETDEYSTVFGFRSIKVENYRFVLNGEPIRLMGVEWMPGSSLEHGMAETPADLEKNLNLLKNANCIYTRFHWQQDEHVLDWCDRHGILVQEEIPYWGGLTRINDTLLNLGKQQLNEMIDAHYNHPSIITWGIGNELDSRDTLNITSLKSLYSYTKHLDSSRLVNYVSNKLGYHKTDTPTLPDDASNIGDVLMFNEYYSTWYGQSVDVVPFHLTKITEDYPDKPLVISEWGICEPAHKGGDPRRAKEMVQQLAIYEQQPHIAGAIYFCLNDYRTFIGEDFTYAYPQRVHGVCDIHLTPKPSYDTLKNISSPIIIKSLLFKNGIIHLTLSGKKGIPSYTIRNYMITAGKEKVSIKELKPDEEKTFEIKTDSKEIRIFRPTGFEVLQVKLK